MAWYETKPCAVCKETIGKRRFWQDKPRVVGPGGAVRDAAYIEAKELNGLLATHRLVCPSCYFNRFGDVRALFPDGA